MKKKEVSEQVVIDEAYKMIEMLDRLEIKVMIDYALFRARNGLPLSSPKKKPTK